MGLSMSYHVLKAPEGHSSDEDLGLVPLSRIKRKMPSLATILRQPGRDMRSVSERAKNIAERGHIIGLEVAAALLDAVMTQQDTQEEKVVVAEALSCSLSAPDNFLVTSHKRNMAYFKGEKDLAKYIRGWSTTTERKEYRTEAAQFVVTCIFQYHTKRLRPLMRAMEPTKAGKASFILNCVLSHG